MERVLLNELNKRKEHLWFHTPGHGGQIELDGKLDITELSYSDNLLEAKGALKRLSNNIAKVYSSENVFLSTCGATMLVHVAIHALKNEGSFLIVEPVHKSTHSALRNLRLKTFVLTKESLEYYLDAMVYDDNIYESIDQALSKTKAKNLVLTSPNYFGNILNMDKVAEIKRKHGINIILDSAHGAHYPFSDKLPKWDATVCDIVIHSCHKTMSAMTSGAILHCTNKFKEKVAFAFSDFHTTSPSYPILLSIESACAEFEEKGNTYYEEVFSSLQKFSFSLSCKYSLLPSDDKTRLLIEAPDGEIAKRVLEENGIFIEMLYGDVLVFIVTPYNHNHLEKLARCLNRIDYPSKPFYERQHRKASPYKLIDINYSRSYELIELDDAIGRRAFKAVGVYPPGFPNIYAGQKITKNWVDFFKDKEVFGLVDGKIFVVKQDSDDNK